MPAEPRRARGSPEGAGACDVVEAANAACPPPRRRPRARGIRAAWSSSPATAARDARDVNTR